jgi:hypothetical protein
MEYRSVCSLVASYDRGLLYGSRLETMVSLSRPQSHVSCLTLDRCGKDRQRWKCER